MQAPPIISRYYQPSRLANRRSDDLCCKKLNLRTISSRCKRTAAHLLRPAFYWELFKRRWAYFVLPFVTILSAGVAAALLWPPTYLSEGRILVQSQQIPSELVRPTVTSAAQERIQVIQQRTMTRDNLIAIADKFKLFPDKRALMSPTELVAEVKKNTKIAPVDLQLDFKQRTRAAMENPTIVFSVGFEYGNPAVAAQVANELMTRILNEDLRDRTSRATDTTQVLGARGAETSGGELGARCQDRAAAAHARQAVVVHRYRATDDRLRS